jgi:CHAT domain-containing protein
VLAPGAVAAQQLPAGESQSVAQATPPASKPAIKGIPAEVEKWFEDIVSAADKGDPDQALSLYERVLGWVQTNLPEKHLFRALLMVRHGYLLSRLGKRQEAMTTAREGTDMLRELVKSKQDPDIKYFLSTSLYSLGRRYMELKQSQPAAASFKEALPILQEQASTWSDSLDLLPQTMLLLGQQLEDIGEQSSAGAIYTEALPILREQGKSNPQKRELYGMALSVLAGTRYIIGEYESSLSARQEALKIFRRLAQAYPNSKKLIPLNLQLIGATYFALGSKSSDRKQQQLAQSAYLEAISIWRQQPMSPETARNLASTYQQLAFSFAMTQQSKEEFEARSQAIQTYRELAKLNPEEKGSLAFSLYSTGLAYFLQKEPQKAYFLTKESVDIYKLLIAATPGYRGQYATAIDLLSTIQNRLGQAQLALLTMQEAVLIRRELGSTDVEGITSFANSLSSLSGMHADADNWEKSLELRKEALNLRRRVTEQIHRDPNLITPLMSQMQIATDYSVFLIQEISLLASSYAVTGKSQEALSLTQEAVLLARQLAKTNPEQRELLAYQLTRLASRLNDAGYLQAALSASLEGVQLARDFAKTVPEERELLSDALYELSLRYSSLGRRQDALASSREAMALRREQRKTDSLNEAQLANSQSLVAYNLTNLGQPREAVSLAQDAVKTFRQVDPRKISQQSSLAWSLSLLSYHYSQAGEYRDALSAAEESIAIYRDLVIKRPAFAVELARPLLVLGIAQQSLGNSEQALSNTNEAIQLLRRSSESDLSKRYVLASALNQISQLQVKAGSYHSATASATESVTILRDLSTLTPEALDQLSNSSTTLAALYLRQGQPAAAITLLREAVNSEVRFLQQQLPLMPEGRRQALVDTLGRRWELPYSLALQGDTGASLALYTRINRHGPLQDIERRQGMISRSSGATQALVNRLSILNGQISNPTITAKARQNALAEAERLQEDLYRQLPALQSRLVGIAEVARQLPPDGVLVEFQRFSPYNAAKPEKEAWGKPRYLALLLDQRGTLRAVDLGEADALDQAIATALDRTRLQQPGADNAWAIVTEKVFSPLRSAIEGKRHLLVSPDGQLHRVPFSALALLAGSISSLQTTLTLHTIGSGRDLVTASRNFAPASPALVLADPTTTGWEPLARAASEGQAVSTSLGIQPLVGSSASVAVLEKTIGPSVLHVAGHAYFDPEATGDPLLASGLVLAGADKARQPSRPSRPQHSSTSALPSPPMDDGYLTAKEAARLNLDGTKLVVLSACETGLGLQRTGEGLFGLRRALTVAGARGTLLSLWKVPDAATEIFMSRFYDLLGQGIPPAEAVRRVQAEFRSKPRINGWSDPFYWAAWQYNGLPDPAR